MSEHFHWWDWSGSYCMGCGALRSDQQSDPPEAMKIAAIFRHMSVERARGLMDQFSYEKPQVRGYKNWEWRMTDGSWIKLTEGGLMPRLSDVKGQP